ncbi:hypothetical protein PVW53_14015 [Seohaeicola sp. SP36]|uniref:hypothetical protein n=1 Tax=unclassified Seohaeicola TaxID=2641111 RepID=UPI00237C2074|nr:MULTISPECIES: hypothetical protein [unclassified Seohaeicola]MDD9709714.1 hypothetical protein [Seohaeicola sp. 4SK31]MDD9736646.1 hypothetical protein [Seohaeicola sp. SP36]
MRTIPFILAAIFSTPVSADFIDTQWSVVGFNGEAWFINTQGIIGQSQTFNRGYAEGVFYNCDYAGQSSTYTRYDNNTFFANPEFELFLPLREEMTLSSETLFVHRITCEGGGNPAQRRVMYPFITNEARKSAWYLFEGGVFSLHNP